jgi:hypothetical protein
MFCARSFFPTFNALFIENVFMIIIGPVYDRGLVQYLAAVGASTSTPFMEIVSYLTTALA